MYMYVYVYVCVVCLQLALTIPRLQFNEQLYSCTKSTFFSRVSHLLESTYTLLIREINMLFAFSFMACLYIRLVKP